MKRVLRVLGIDPALNHSAAVLLRQDEESPLVFSREGQWAITPQAGIVKIIEKATAGHLLGGAVRTPPRGKDEGAESWGLRRAETLIEVCRGIRHDLTREGLALDMVVIETPAMGRTTDQDLAGISWLLRYTWWRAGVAVRLYGPSQIRKWYGIPGRGLTRKQATAMMVESNRQAEIYFAEFQTKGYADTYGDLVDAYAFAKMGITEMRIKGGALDLRTLTTAQREVLHATSYAHKRNLLVRPFLER